jgi:hypothetical protein
MSKFAVILCDLESSQLSEVLSTHRSDIAATRALPDIPGAYVAQRKADGEWETRLEARDRREAPPVLGRPAEMVGGKRVNVYLDDDSLARAKALGGNVSEGIRVALARAALPA